MLVRSFGIALAAAMSLTACGAGGSGGGSGGGPASGGGYGGIPPTASPKSNVPIQQEVAGKPAFVDPANDRTLYFLDVDTPTGGKCTGGCLDIWFPLVPSAGSHSQGDFTIVMRSDGTSKQWDYKNHPLYRYAGDSGPDQDNGNGIPFAGGHWHTARPT